MEKIAIETACWLRSLWNLNRLLIGAFNKEEVLVGTFSDHCESLRSLVGSTNKNTRSQQPCDPTTVNVEHKTLPK